MSIIDNTHPDYNTNLWTKWRLTYKSGQEFLNQYLTKFTSREEGQIYHLRKNISYVPAFAKSAVNDIRNAIYQRVTDIIRDGGSQSYQEAIYGANGGVDLLGSTMSFFIGQKILPELLPMSKVGVYVDMPRLSGPTKLDKGNTHPYFYVYPIEDIRNWISSASSPNEFDAVVLRDHDFEYDPNTNLPISKITRYRHLYLQDNKVHVDFYDENGEMLTQEILNINKIPFYVSDLGDSILADVCEYQIALMNMESSDLAYILLANYPFYVEEFDPRQSALFNQGEDEETVRTGITQGRRYPVGTNPPQFINPSSEPLKASMEKENQLKSDIKALVNIAVSNMGAKMASAESKQMDMIGLEAGLAYIGSVLQNLESRLGYFWSLYENSNPPIVLYPTEYSLPDQSVVDARINQAINVMEKVNSSTLRRTLAKRIARLSVGNRVPLTILDQIDQEIDDAPIIYTDPKTTTNDVINGILDPETAAIGRGYPEGVVQAAQDYQARRVAIIQAAQSPAARGINDLSVDTNASKAEKLNGDGTPKPVRGEGK